MDINELESFKLSDAVAFHKELNPKLWENEKLDPEVRDQLLLIAEDFVEYLGISNLKVRDVTISGSNAAYSYTPHSDIDLHVLVDFNELPNNEVYQELFTAKKTLYNDAHDITVRDVPVELYVQDTNNPVHSLGEYSIVHDKWIRIPKKRRANFDQAATKLKYEKLGELIELALKTKDPKRVNDTIALIKRYRKSGLDKAGEFGPENLAYKAVRKQGLVQALHDLKVQLHTEKLSIDEYANEDYDPNGPPPGPEFKPTMPAGTVRVDVSDVYDWYKLGQHVSNLKGLGKHDFGKGPPSTILSFGDEDTEHKYIQDLEKTGLTTTDIDPIDPNQPKGMKRQKTDPTYNVNETDDRKAAVLKIQKHLNKKYGANLDLDGKLGPLTLKSINKFMPKAKTGLADEPNKTTAVQGKKLKEAKIDAHRQGDTIWINYFEVPEKGKGLGTQEYMKFEKSLPKDIKKIRLVASDAGYGPTHEFWDRMGFDYAYPDDDNEMVKILEASGKPITKHIGKKVKVDEEISDLKVYRNPSPKQLYNLTKRSVHQHMRGMYHAGDSYWWDANDAIHKSGADYLGIPYDYLSRMESSLGSVSGSYRAVGDDNVPTKIIQKYDIENELVNESSDTNLVYRVDKTKIPNFEKNLKTYYHNDDWSMSGSKWEGATGSAKGLYAHPDKLFVALYAAGTPKTNRYVATYNTSPPMVYFDKKDVPKFKNTKSYLTAFDASNFKKVPSGEVFSEMPGKPVHQIEITDPFKFIKQQGWDIKLVDDLPAKLKEIQKIAKQKDIKVGAEGMGLTESSDYNQYENEIENFVQSLNPDDVGVEQIGPYHVHFEGFTDECQRDAERRCNLPSDNPRHLANYDDVYKEVIRDFVRREGGKKPLKVGFAGYQDYPVIYAVFDNPEPYKNPDAWNPKIDESIVYHVTPTKNVKSIMRDGLRPQVGKRSKKIPGEANGIFVFNSKSDAEDAIMNWLGDEFGEDEALTLLAIDARGLEQHMAPGAGYETIIDAGIEPSRIRVTNDLLEASGYIPSAKEKNDPRFKTALTVDVRPDAIKKNAKAFGFKTSRAGIPPQARADGKIAEDLMREFKTFLGEQQEEMFPGYDEQHREKRLGNWLAKSWGVHNGKPQTFYHATTKDFDTFNTHGTGFASALGMAYEVERHGSFFAVDPKFAEGFIEDPNTGRVKEGGRVLPVHLSIQSPIDLRDDALSRMLSDEETVDEFKANDIDLRSIYNHFYELERWELFDGPEGAEFIDNLQKLGFDGAIINEAIPNNSNAKSGQVWVAFSPNQVKSVYNRGSFSSDDARLMRESSELEYLGNCTEDDVVDDIFGNVSEFARVVEEHGDEFTLGNLVVKYDDDQDIHYFYKNSG